MGQSSVAMLKLEPPLRIVGGALVAEIQLVSGGKTEGDRSKMIIATTYNILLSLRFVLIDFLFSSISFFIISVVITDRPIDDRMITDMDVKSSNLAKVAPA